MLQMLHATVESSYNGDKANLPPRCKSFLILYTTCPDEEYQSEELLMY